MPSVSRILTVARLTFREAWRRKVVVAALVMTVGFLALYGTAIHFAAKDIAASSANGGPAGMGELWKAAIGAQLLYVGLFPSSLIVGLMAVLASAGSIAAEVDSGVLHGVLARPIRRWELVLGKFLGIGTMVTAYTLVLMSAVILIVKMQIDVPVMHIPSALALLVLEPLILLGIAVLGSSRLSTMATGVLCVAAYGIAVIGGFIEQIGSFINNQVMMNIGIVSSLAMPVDAIHRKAVGTLLPIVTTAQEMGPFGGGGAMPSVWMVVYAVAYLLGAVALSTRVFAKRDL